MKGQPQGNNFVDLYAAVYDGYDLYKVNEKWYKKNQRKKIIKIKIMKKELQKKDTQTMPNKKIPSEEGMSPEQEKKLDLAVQSLVKGLNKNIKGKTTPQLPSL